jgi:hypothetical protein
MNNKRAFLAHTAFLVLLTVNCHAQSTRALIGKWFFENFEGAEMVIMEFTPTHMTILELEDEDDEAEAEAYRYQANDKTITIDGETLHYTVQNGNTLMLSTSGGEKYTGKKLQANVTTLSGKYELVNDMGFIEMLEFIDKSTVRLHGDVLGMATRTTHQYRISGSKVIISDPSGSMTLDIIGDSIIKGNTFGGLGGDSIFIKQ